MGTEWFEKSRQREDKIIERSSSMRRRPRREVLEVVVPYDHPGMFRAHPHARHPCVTIRVGEINIPGDKNILIIRAARCQDQDAENCDFNDALGSANHRFIPRPRCPIRNPKFRRISRLSGSVTGIRQAVRTQARRSCSSSDWSRRFAIRKAFFALFFTALRTLGIPRVQHLHRVAENCVLLQQNFSRP